MLHDISDKRLISIPPFLCCIYFCNLKYEIWSQLLFSCVHLLFALVGSSIFFWNGFVCQLQQYVIYLQKRESCIVQMLCILFFAWMRATTQNSSQLTVKIEVVNEVFVRDLTTRSSSRLVFFSLLYAYSRPLPKSEGIK